jgi:hypothetical protein
MSCRKPCTCSGWPSPPPTHGVSPSVAHTGEHEALCKHTGNILGIPMLTECTYSSILKDKFSACSSVGSGEFSMGSVVPMVVSQEVMRVIAVTLAQIIQRRRVYHSGVRCPPALSTQKTLGPTASPDGLSYQARYRFRQVHDGYVRGRQ